MFCLYDFVITFLIHVYIYKYNTTGDISLNSCTSHCIRIVKSSTFGVKENLVQDDLAQSFYVTMAS